MKLPKTIFIKWDYETQGDPVLVCDENLMNLSEENETIEIGIYELKAVKKLVNKSELK